MKENKEIETTAETIKNKRESKWNPRNYCVTNASGHMVSNIYTNESECREWIINSGNVDEQYFITYSVTTITPIVKTTKIIIK